MDTKLVSENDKSFTIAANGKEIIVAKTPGAQKLLTALKAKGATVVPAGKVPGKAKIPGDSPQNDTVNIKASPGEGIIPREAMSSIDSAMEFVKRLFAHKESGGMAMSEGGEVAEATDAKDQDPAYMFKGGKLCYYGGGAVVDPEEAKKAADSMRKAFGKYATGGIVADPKKKEDDSDDEEDGGADGDTEVSQAVSMASNENPKKPRGYAFGTGPDGVEDPNDMQIPAPFLTDTAPQPTPAVATPTLNAMNQPGPTNINYVPPVQTPDQTGVIAPSPDNVLPNGGAAPLATATTSPDTKMKQIEVNQTHGILGADKKDVKKETEKAATLMEASGDLAAKQMEKEGAEIKRYTQEVAQKNDEFETNRIFRQTQIDNKLEDVDKTRQKYLSMKVDPKHLWGDEGTGNRLMAAAGIILGGIGQAFNGKDNPAIGIVDNALKRDVEIQKANIAKAGDNLDAQTNMYKEFKDKLGDDAMAEKATLATMKDRFANQLDLIAKTAGSEQTRNKASQAAQQIRLGTSQDLAKLGGFIKTTTEQEETAKPLGDAPNDVQKLYLDKQNGYNGLKKIRDQYAAMGKDDKASPLSVRVNHIAQVFGIDDPDLTSLEAKIKTQVAELVHEKSGTGSSKGEYERLENTYPNLLKNPATFQKMLDEEINNKFQGMTDMEKQYKGYQRLPNRNITTTKSDVGMTKVK